MKIRKKKYFTGGGIDNATTSSMGTISSAASGDVGGIAKSLFGNAKKSAELMNSGKLSGGQKFGLMLGNMGGGIVGGNIATSLIGSGVQEQLNNETQFENDIAMRNQLLGLEDGGNLGNMDPRYAKLLPANFNFDSSISPDTALNQPPRVEYRISNKPIFTAKVGKVPDYEAAYPTEKRIEDSMNQQQKLYDQYIDNRGMLKDTTGFTQVAPGTYFNPTINRIFRASDSKDSLGIYGGFRIPKNDAQRRILSNIIKETRRNEPSVRKEIEQPIQLEEFTPKQQVESISLPKRGAPRDLKNMSPAFLQFIKEAQESDDLGPAETNPKKAKRYKQVKDISFADGGNLNYFDGGYTHDEQDDENIFEGIPQGRTPEGDTNVVEKGETRWQDYIFSDSLTLDKNMIKMLNLPKSYGNKTFAKISKNINKELEERPHDPYTQESVSRRMNELKQVNNLVANKENTVRMAKYGGTIKHAGGLPLILAEQQTPQYQGVGNYGTPLMQQLVTGSGSDEPIRTTIDRINNFRQPVPEQQMPEQSAEEETSPVQNTNYLNIAEIMRNMPPEERTAYVQKLAATKNPFGELTAQGYTPGTKGVSMQNKTKGTPFYGGVNAQMVNQVTNPAFLNRLFGGPKESYTEEDVQRLQRELAYDPEASQYIVNPADKKFGVDHLVASAMGEGNMTPMKSRPFTIPNQNAGLAPIPGQRTPDEIPPPEKETPKETPETQGSPSKIRDYSWIPSMIGGAASFWPLPEVQQANPTTMNVGQLNPKMVDEQTMRANIDAANRAYIAGVQGAGLGSGAATRAALLAQGANYGNSISDAFLRSNIANAQAKMQADQFNIGTQADVAARNMGTLNRADEINTGAINERNMQQYDTRLSGFQDMMDTASKKLQEKAKMDMFAKVHGYNSFGEYANAQQANRLKRNVTKPVSKYNLAKLQSTVPVTNPVQSPIDTTPIISNQGAALPVVNPTNYFWNTGAIQQKCGGSIRTKRRSLM